MPHPKCLTLAAIDALDLAPLIEAGPGSVVEGFTILAGGATADKSWRCLDRALAVGPGGNAMGTIACEQGDAATGWAGQKRVS